MFIGINWEVNLPLQLIEEVRHIVDTTSGDHRIRVTDPVKGFSLLTSNVVDVRPQILALVNG